MGNWTFSKEDDFTLPNGEWKTLPADSLERIHNEFAKECKLQEACNFIAQVLAQFFLREIFLDFYILYVRYSTLLHLPPLRFHCVGGCWDRTQDSCDYDIGCQTLYHMARSHPIHLDLAQFSPLSGAIVKLGCIL
jgi:hypothetical protein